MLCLRVWGVYEVVDRKGQAMNSRKLPIQDVDDIWYGY